MTNLPEEISRRVLETVSNLRAGAHIIYHTFPTKDQLKPFHRTHKEHLQILDAMRSGDEYEARQVMAKHIRYGCQLALEANSTRHMEIGHAHPPTIEVT